MTQWQKVRIGDLFNFEKGSLQSSKCTSGKYDFITAGKYWKTHNKYTHKCEALIIAVAASGSLGRTHYIKGKFVSSDLCFILTLKNEQKYPLNLSFYHFVFNSLRKVLVAATKSGTSKEAINQKNLKKYEIPYFDIKQQNFWIKKLKNTKIQKELLNKEMAGQQSLLKKLRQQILQEAIEGKLTQDWRVKNPDVEPASELLKRIQAEKQQLIKDKKIKVQKLLPVISEDEKPFTLPNGWAWCLLGEISNNIHYGANKSAKHIYQGVRLLRITDIQNNKVNWDTVPSCDYSDKDIQNYNLENQDILIARTGGTIGKSYLVINIPVQSLFASYLIRVIPNSNIFAKYLKCFLESSFYWQQLHEAAWGAGQPNVNGTKLKKLCISIPPLAEQKAIIAKVEKLLSICDKLQTQITTTQTHAEQLMQAVLKAAFTQSEQPV